ncbi:hypothetical protein V1507DRAFT_435236 [Lipomyces tetrasporus]
MSQVSSEIDERHTHEESEASSSADVATNGTISHTSPAKIAEISTNQSDSAVGVANADLLPDYPRAQQYASLMNDQVIKDMLRSPTLQHHLVSVHEILSYPAVSGETTIEGRHDVALKKFRELRAGGTEDNIEVEEFVGRVLDILEGRAAHD